MCLEITLEKTNSVITCDIRRYTKSCKDEFLHNQLCILLIRIGILGDSYVALFTSRIWTTIIIIKEIPNLIHDIFYITEFLSGLEEAA